MEDPVGRRTLDDLAYEGQSIVGFHPSMPSLLGDIAGIELTKLYGDFMPTIKVGNVIEINALAMTIEAHKVLKIPRCVVCSKLMMHPREDVKKTVYVPTERIIK